MKKHTVTVFGSARGNETADLLATSYKLGGLIAEAGWVLCNGGYGGTMEAAARGAAEKGGEIVAVTVESFQREPNPYSSKVISRSRLLERLESLLELGDAFVVLPGGTGTLLEIAAVLEFQNKGMFQMKPMILYSDYWRQYFDSIKDILCKVNKSKTLELLYLATATEEIIEIIRTFFHDTLE